MGNDCCESSISEKLNGKTTILQIERVSNGYIVGGYGFERRVALTLAEALEIIRKRME